MGLHEVMKMELTKVPKNEEKEKEAVIEDDSEPYDLEDRLYKEWLEEPQTFGSVKE